jgi:hypothetical protein
VAENDTSKAPMSHVFTVECTRGNPLCLAWSTDFIYQNPMSSLRKSGVNDARTVVTLIATPSEAL